MAPKDFEEDDPMELVGMVIGTNDDMMEEMGLTFIDEFLRMGWPPDAIIGLFRDPFYRAPHSILCKRGERYVIDLVERVQSARATTTLPKESADGKGT